MMILFQYNNISVTDHNSLKGFAFSKHLFYSTLDISTFKYNGISLFSLTRV
jgi:hypothetical protein